MTTLEKFKAKFDFKAKLLWHVNITRQAFATAYFECVTPDVPQILRELGDDTHFRATDSPYLLEIRTEFSALRNKERELQALTNRTNRLSLMHCARLTERDIVWGKDRRLYVQQTASTHIEVCVPGPEAALHIYNTVQQYYSELCEMTGSSRRLTEYRAMYPNADPKPYKDWGAFYEDAEKRGFVEDPDQCDSLIRITKRGAVEFRMFDATQSLERVVGWANVCHALCKSSFYFLG